MDFFFAAKKVTICIGARRTHEKGISKESGNDYMIKSLMIELCGAMCKKIYTMGKKL